MEVDGSSSDSDQENELLLKEIESTENKISANPFSYDDHVQLIKLYRKGGDLDGARTARNNMARLFPLSESLWLEWIRDELPLASVPAALEDLKSLFAKAVEDYLSVQLWVEYCSFALEKMSDLGGVSFVRDVFERAITEVGLHTAEGGVCWSMYREFEKTVFQSLQEMQFNEEEDFDLKQQVEEQYERIEKLFKRHLGVPICGIHEVFEEYKSFSDSVITDDNLPSYTRATSRLNILLPFEEELSSGNDTLGVYKKYIGALKDAKEESTIINIVFQRALADHPLQYDLWREYITFMSKNFAGIAPVLLKGHKQAVRNCPWVKDFWISYVQVQEKAKVPHEEIIATLELSVGDNYTESQSYLDLWTCYCDYLRRRTESLDEGTINDLRRLFRRSREHLDTYFGADGDPKDSLSQYQASLEARCYSNMEETRLLWTDVMKRHGKETNYWIQYAQLERVYGELSLCRKVLLMGVNSANDDPERMCHELLQFEREQGTLDTYQQAVERCASQLARIQDRKEKATEKDQLKQEERKKQRKERRKQAKEPSGKKQENETGQTGNVAGKRKRQSQTIVFYDGVADGGTMKKSKVDDVGPVTEPTGTSFVPSTDATEKMEVQSQQDNTAANEGGYDPLKFLARDDSKVEQKRIHRVEKGMEKKDETVFVSNLSFNSTEEQLREIFQNCGEIVDVRLIKTRKPGGVENVFAYIEFTSSAPIQQALLLDREVLNHRPMFVSPCDKSNSTSAKDTKPKYSEETTVYVTNIPFNANEEQLQKIFQEAGEVKEVRLVRNRQGRSKGFAYIEYSSEVSLGAVVMKLDQYNFNGRNLNVAISKPPSTSNRANTDTRSREGYKSAITDTLPTASGPAVGGKKRISLVPRAIARKGPPTKPDDRVPVVKKSNEDFRNLLLKKD